MHTEFLKKGFQFRAETLFLLIGMVFVLLFFFPVVIGRSSFFFRDFFYLDFPKAHYAVSTIRGGGFPFWDPLNGSGMPFFIIMANRLLYPPSWFLFLCPPETLAVAFSNFLVLHFLFATAGMFYFLRIHAFEPVSCLVGALVFALNGYMIMMTSNPLYLISASWFPVSMICALKLHRAWRGGRRVAVVKAHLAVVTVFACQFFHGETQGAYVNALIAAGYFLYLGLRSKATSPLFKTRFYVFSLLTVVLLGLIVAVQLVPFLEYFQVSPRSYVKNFKTAFDFSYHPARLITHLIPYFFGNCTLDNPLWGNYLNSNPDKMLWSVTSYSGVLTIYLFALAWVSDPRKALPWAVFMVAMLLASCGRGYGVYGLLREVLPLFDRFRYPEKMLPYFYFALGTICAIGIEGIRAVNTGRRRKRAATVSSGMLVIILLAAALYFQPDSQARMLAWIQQHASPAEAAMAAGYRDREAGLAFGLQALIAVLGLSACLKGRRWGRAVVILLLVINLADLYHHNRKTNYTLPASLLFTRPQDEPALALRMREGLDSPWAGRYLVDPNLNGRSMSFAAVDYKLGWFMAHRELLRTRTNSLFGLSNFMDSAPLNNGRIQRMQYGGLDSHFASTIQLFNIRFFVGSRQVPGQPWKGRPIGRLAAAGLLRKVRDQPVPGTVLYEVTRTLPAFFLAHDWQMASDEQDLIRKTFNPATIFEKATVEDYCHNRSGRRRYGPIPRPAPPGARRAITAEGMTLVSWGPERVELEVDVRLPGLAVLNAYPAPGWKVHVDGREGPLFHVNYLMMGAHVSPGRHRVIFSYRPSHFGLALAASMAGLTVWGLAVVFAAGRFRPRSRPGTGLPGS